MFPQRNTLYPSGTKLAVTSVSCEGQRQELTMVRKMPSVLYTQPITTSALSFCSSLLEYVGRKPFPEWGWQEFLDRLGVKSPSMWSWQNFGILQ